MMPERGQAFISLNPLWHAFDRIDRIYMIRNRTDTLSLSSMARIPEVEVVLSREFISRMLVKKLVAKFLHEILAHY